MRVADVLASKGTRVCTIDQYDALNDAVGVMRAEDIGAVVVMNGHSGVAIGIISQTEVLKSLQQFGYSALKQNARAVMRKPAPQCLSETSIRGAMRQMTDDRTRHLLVIAADSAIEGLVSMGDLVAARLHAAELETNVLRDMAQSHMLTGTA